VIIFDSTFLVVYLNPNAPAAMDRHGKPVEQFKERVAHLAGTLDASNEPIGVPAPAMAEVLVRAGGGRAQLVSVLSERWRFQILPFDSRAAIEASELIALVKSNKEKWDTWAKVKFDIQIVAIAKAEGARVIYADDKDIENLAKRVKIPVMRICDLQLPPVEKESVIEVGPLGSQGLLSLGEAKPEQINETKLEPKAEVKSDATIAPATPTITAATKESDQLQANPAHSAPVQGSDGGRAEGEAAAEGGKEGPGEVTTKPCECGCGGFPKDPNSRFLPGHDLRKAYNDQKPSPSR
jgi:predicted nucleic acid-binding protein